MFIAAGHVSDIDSQLKHIELQVAEAKSLLATQQSRISLTFDTLKIIEGITPKLTIEFNPNVRKEGGEDLLITFDIKNEGDFGFEGDSIEVYFADTPIIDENDARTKPQL
jgi:hypothetical protein